MATQKINAIQGLRAIAFLAIFISHTGLGNFGCLGAWGVSIFFVLSGFLMMLSHLNKEDELQFSFGFAWNKIRSLYPLHFVTMLFAAVYAAFCGQHLMKVSLDIVIHALLIQMWIPNTHFYTTLNGPAWYLCTSFFLYLCFPVIYKVFRRCVIAKSRSNVYILGIAALTLLYVLIAAICYLYAPQESSAWFTTQWIVYYFPPVRLIDFSVGCLTGCLFYVKRVSQKLKQTKPMRVIAEITVCIVIVFSWGLYAAQCGILGSQAFRFSLLFMPTSTILIWLIARGEGVLARVLENKLIVKVGDLSPYTFLIHGVAIKYCTVLFQYLSYNNRTVITVAAFFLTMIAALTWKLFHNTLLASSLVWKSTSDDNGRERLL